MISGATKSGSFKSFKTRLKTQSYVKINQVHLNPKLETLLMLLNMKKKQMNLKSCKTKVEWVVKASTAQLSKYLKPLQWEFLD